MNLRTSLDSVLPPWLRGFVGSRLLYSIAIILDTYWETKTQGVRAALPGLGTSTALVHVGSDDQIDRYPGETDVEYSARLNYALDTLRGWGGARELVNQIQTWLRVPVRVVTNTADWTWRDSLASEFQTYRVSPTNWDWDGLPRWWRAWVIVDMSAGPWAPDGVWDSPGAWDDGGMWDTTATIEDVKYMQRVIRKWKPLDKSVYLIITYDGTLFRHDLASPPNPAGNGSEFAWQATQNAAFGGFIT